MTGNEPAAWARMELPLVAAFPVPSQLMDAPAITVTAPRAPNRQARALPLLLAGALGSGRAVSWKTRPSRRNIPEALAISAAVCNRFLDATSPQGIAPARPVSSRWEPAFKLLIAVESENGRAAPGTGSTLAETATIPASRGWPQFLAVRATVLAAESLQVQAFLPRLSRSTLAPKRQLKPFRNQALPRRQKAFRLRIHCAVSLTFTCTCSPTLPMAGRWWQALPMTQVAPQTRPAAV